MTAKKENRYAAKYDKGEMDKICEELLDWAENSRSIHFSNFCRKALKKSRKWLYATAVHYPKLQETIEEAKELLAAKLVDACWHSSESGVNAAFGVQYLPIYDSEFKDLIKWKAEINKEQPTKDINREGFNEWHRRIKAGEPTTLKS